MKENFIRIFGHRLSYQDVTLILIALVLWNLLLSWHDRYQAYKPVSDVSVSQRFVP